MINQEFLDKWVPILVDEKYGPDKRLESGKPLLCITIYSPEEMDKFKNKFYPDVGDDIVLRGHILSMGEYMKFAKADNYKKFMGRYLIKLNAGLTEAEAIFCLSHEIGHLVGYITNDPKHIEEPDEFADNFALRQAKELIEDPSLRLKVILEGLSNDFKHR